MRLKQLSSLLENVRPFQRPKIVYEQYSTSAHIAANILHKIFTDFDEDLGSLSVADLGSGAGIFTVGAAALGAGYVLAVDLDSEAILDTKQNLDIIDEQFDDLSSSVELIQADVRNEQMFAAFEKKFDVVVMNPPFGTKREQGIDMIFLQRALQLSTEAVYSLHKSATRKYIVNKFEKVGINATVLSQIRFDLPQTYKCHKQATRDIDVDFIKFTFD
ncbi:methyltransferase-like protein 5 [Dinothrombium tinctorium]|uniref:Methyltransferase-like protein 5 n=1 Tax=Dinothrombium tinctorium TaxID=1965070 RepID=A0A3S3RJE8_9ACAR|nr:methyltransferase-like protein 5 [Dinothrombium tinctorium]RWS01837.1 methyltransferase-like protein 5 [Dinothrombium tinctorium]RWS11218.1 methyltransferase-like protein 5 [Dinothrombium tinctorium]